MCFVSSLIPLLIGFLMFQDQNSTVRVRKDSQETVKTHYMSYTGPAVPNVAKAAASNTAQKELKGEQLKSKNSRKKG